MWFSGEVKSSGLAGYLQPASSRWITLCVGCKPVFRGLSQSIHGQCLGSRSQRDRHAELLPSLAYAGIPYQVFGERSVHLISFQIPRNLSGTLKSPSTCRAILGVANIPLFSGSNVGWRRWGSCHRWVSGAKKGICQLNLPLQSRQSFFAVFLLKVEKNAITSLDIGDSTRL